MFRILVILSIIITVVRTEAFAMKHHEEDGFVVVSAQGSVAQAVDRLTAAIEAKGATVFAVVDHAAGAARVDLDLEPTTLVIFGNPKLGTPLMQSDRRMGVELPLKMLVWSEGGRTMVGYHDPRAFADYYALDGREDVLATMKGALSNFAKAAAGE